MKSLVASTFLLAAYAAPADAAVIVQSGVGPGGMKWTATSYMVGATSTGTTPPEGSPSTTPGGGNPIYLAPNRSGYSGVVGLLITLDDGRTGSCSGTLVGDRSVVTAGHCVSMMGGVKWDAIARTQVIFQDDAGSDGDERFYDESMGVPMPGVTAIDVSNYAVHPGYLGSFAVDQNDIAVLTLAQVAPAFAQRYEIYTEDLTGKQFNLTGYGLRSSVGGAEGTTAAAESSDGFRRQGANVFDYAWGNEAFGGIFTDREPNFGYHTFGLAEVEYSFVTDFDNGLTAQDASCVAAQDEGGVSAADADRLGFCTLGLGIREATPSSGDSGGGGFIDGRLASVTSYGIVIERANFGGGSNSGFGDLAGYVPTFIHVDFIRNAIAAVPEPATWAQMLLGFGMVGVATRRRQRRVAAA